MTLELVVPEANVKGRTTKDLVFSLLIEAKAMTLTQLHRGIKRRYGKSVTFQAVIKAVKSLLEHKVLVKKKRLYSLNKDWIFEIRNFFDRLYTHEFKVKRPMKKVELGKEVTVYTIHNLLELDRLWNDLLMNWAKKEEKDKRNVWKGRHCWWLIPRLQEEDLLHDYFTKRKIKTYNLLSENTVLDRISFNYYLKKREKIKVSKKAREKTDVHLSAFGDYLVKFEIPTAISYKLERIYKKTRKIEDLDLKKVLDIFKEKTEIEVMVIKDKLLADKVKEEVISYF